MVNAQDAIFTSPLTEYVTTPADGEFFKNIHREIVLKADVIVLKTFRNEGDTDMEIWDLVGGVMDMQLVGKNMITSYMTYLIFDGVRVNAQWDIITNEDRKVEVIARTITNDRGEEPLITRYHIE